MQVLCVGSRAGTAAVLCQRSGEEPEAPRVPAPDRCLRNPERRGSAHVRCKLCQRRALQTPRYDPMPASGCPYMAKFKHGVVCVCVHLCVCVFYVWLSRRAVCTNVGGVYEWSLSAQYLWMHWTAGYGEHCLELKLQGFTLKGPVCRRN